MVLAWRPDELQGYISKYFQNNITGVEAPYSHASLLYWDVEWSEWVHVEACIDGVEATSINLKRFMQHYANRVDVYVFEDVHLGNTRLSENIFSVVQCSTATTYETLYRALIGFKRHGNAACCTSVVLDSLGIVSQDYHSVFETVYIIASIYPLVNVYSGV